MLEDLTLAYQARHYRSWLDDPVPALGGSTPRAAAADPRLRGHWRRPSAGWKDQRMRWIEPYWRGPDLAAVIERAYKLVP